MDICSIAIFALLIGFTLCMLLNILGIIIDKEGVIYSGYVCFALGFAACIILTMAGLFLPQKPMTFDKSGSSILYSKNEQLMYIDPRDGTEHVVDLDEDKNVEITYTKEESRVEWKTSKWLCFKTTKTIYYIHVDE